MRTKAKMPLWKINKDFISYAAPIIHKGGLKKTDSIPQHGATTRYSHCVSVAYYSLRAANKFKIPCDAKSLVRGALLHDYYFYDWHEKNISHLKNGYIHPKVALHNAMRDYDLNPLEQNIIVRHMFPVTPLPPKHREGFIVCITDKLCGLAETFGVNKIPLPDSTDLWGNK
jgi:Predicted HD superfamily hydrolase